MQTGLSALWDGSLATDRQTDRDHRQRTGQSCCLFVANDVVRTGRDIVSQIDN